MSKLKVSRRGFLKAVLPVAGAGVVALSFVLLLSSTWYER